MGYPYTTDVKTAHTQTPASSFLCQHGPLDWQANWAARPNDSSFPFGRHGFHSALLFLAITVIKKRIMVGGVCGGEGGGEGE